MASDDTALAFPAEEIPDEDLLYMRVHKMWVRDDGSLRAGAFQERRDECHPETPPGMSTEWEKYSSPAEARSRAKTPADNGVISLRAGSVREIDPLTVEHTPKKEVRAHTDVRGLPPKKRDRDDPRVRVELRRLSTWEIDVRS